MIALLSPRLWIALALAGAIAFSHFAAYRSGRAAIRLQWDAAVSAQRAADLAQAESNARETLRRLERQQENQNAQDKMLAAARRDAALNAAAADSLRTQSAQAARKWADALSHSPTVSQCAAAGSAIVVQADVLGRLDKRASELAEFAWASRVAGLKCQADYEALTPR